MKNERYKVQLYMGKNTDNGEETTITIASFGLDEDAFNYAKNIRNTLDDHEYEDSWIFPIDVKVCYEGEVNDPMNDGAELGTIVEGTVATFPLMKFY